MRKMFLVMLAFALAGLCGWSDTIAFENGTVWQNVKITSFRVSDGKPEFNIVPTAVSTPSGLKGGWHSGIRRADFAAAPSPEDSQPRQATPAYPPIETTVQSVIQADMLRLDTGQKVKLLGVDAPDTTDPNRPLEYFGREAFLNTRQKTEGQRVRIEFDRRRMDDFGQLLGYMYLADGTFLNLDLVRSGYAHAWFGEPMNDENMQRFREADASARREQLGLWNAQRREASRQWQIAQPIPSSGSSSAKSSVPSSSDYTRPSRNGQRSVAVSVQYSERPVFGWGGYGGYGMPSVGTAINYSVQPR